MNARLLCKFGELKGSEFEIGAEATLGRGDANTVVLPSNSISGDHARIYWDGEAARYVIEDRGSLNGTRVDGVAVSGRQRLQDLNVLTIGKTVELIFVVGRPSTTAARGVAEPGETTAPAALTLPGQAVAGTPIEPSTEATTQVDVEALTLPESLEHPAGRIPPEDVEEIDLDRTVVDADLRDMPKVPRAAEDGDDDRQ